MTWTTGVLGVFIVALVLHFCFFIPSWHQEIVGAISSSPEQSREAQLLARWGNRDYYQRTAFIRQHTPPDSMVILPPQTSGFGEIGNLGLTDYFLFPRHTAHQTSVAQIADYPGPIYRVSLPGFEANTLYLERVWLDDQFALLTIKHGSTSSASGVLDFINIQPGWTNVTLAWLKLGLIILSGVYLVMRFFGLKTLIGFLASSLLVGLLLNTILFIGLSLVQIPITQTVQFGLLILASIPGLLYIFQQRNLLPAKPKRLTSTASVVTVMVVIFLLFLFHLSMDKPILTWDAVAIWGIKARAIFSFDTLSATKYWGAWPEYPPLVPVAMAQLAIGGEALSKIIFPLFACCLYALFYEALADQPLPDWLHIALPVLPLLAPQIIEHTQIAYANLALTVYIAWAFYLLARWLYSADDSYCFPAMLAWCGVTLARPDGEIYLAYAGLLSLAWLTFQYRRRLILLWFLLPWSVNLLWKLFYSVELKSTASFSYFGTASQGKLLAKLMLEGPPQLADLLEVISFYVQYISSLWLWGAIPLVFGGLLLLAPRRLWQKAPLESGFIGLGLMGLAVLAAYIGPHWGNEYFFNVTFIRLYMVLIPILYFVILRFVQVELATVLAEKQV